MYVLSESEINDRFISKVTMKLHFSLNAMLFYVEIQKNKNAFQILTFIA